VGFSANDVWIVGHFGSRSSDHLLYVLHWNGSRLQALIIPYVHPTFSPFASWQEHVWIGTDGAIWIVGDTQTWRVPLPIADACLSDASVSPF
jgi:hypothetical protein